MLTVTLALLFLAAAVAGLCRRPRTGLMVLIAALALFWVGGTGRLTAKLLDPLQRPYPTVREPRWGRRTAIVVLGAGALRSTAGEVQPTVLGYARIVEGVRLYRLGAAGGHACTLLLCGGDALGAGLPEAVSYGAVARDLGVPQGALLLETRSLNTFRNAEYAAPMLRAGGFDRVILVTSALHMRRSLLYFSRFGIETVPAATGPLTAMGTLLPVAYNLALADFALHEYLGVQRLRLYDALGWNGKPSGRPGAP
jgi:uncharacterized SAM-binding protein YcdF (DUF218 family)